jgi:hypothetical protein
MCKRMAFAGLAATLCLGLSCRIIIDGDGDGRSFLDQMDASITIWRAIGDNQADVSATITDNLGFPFTMTGDQAVEVNGVALVGPDANAEYTATVAAAGEYEITMVEPTFGVESTTVDAPAEFTITAPTEGGTVSLSGFTLRWSGANDRLRVAIRLSQTYQGTETRSFGPFTDTGRHDFTAADLAPFVHGGTLTLSIRVTKINTVNDVAGFNSGTARVQTSASRVARPGP